MALVVQVQIVDDKTGEVSRTFVEKYDAYTSWDTARVIRYLFERVFKAEFGPDNDDWV